MEILIFAHDLSRLFDTGWQNGIYFRSCHPERGDLWIIIVFFFIKNSFFLKTCFVIRNPENVLNMPWSFGPNRIRCFIINLFKIVFFFLKTCFTCFVLLNFLGSSSVVWWQVLPATFFLLWVLFQICKGHLKIPKFCLKVSPERRL